MKPLPELKTEHLALKRAYRNLFKSPDARLVLDDLDHWFNGPATRNPNKLNDVNALFAFNAGARSVLLHIDNMMRDKDATTD
jgi:hypothetical protein